MQHFNDLLIISGVEYAVVLQNVLSEFLPEVPRGLYVKGQVYPVILEGKPYYTANGFKNFTPVDVMSCKDNLYSEDGKLVVPAFIMQNKEKFFTSLPEYNPILFDIIQTYIESHFELVCPYFNKSQFSLNKLNSFLVNCDLNAKDLFTYYLDSLTLRLSAFMAKNIWSDYKVELRGLDFAIYKGEDYRILDWMKNNGY